MSIADLALVLVDRHKWSAVFASDDSDQEDAHIHRAGKYAWRVRHYKSVTEINLRNTDLYDGESVVMGDLELRTLLESIGVQCHEALLIPAAYAMFLSGSNLSVRDIRRFVERDVRRVCSYWLFKDSRDCWRARVLGKAAI